MVVGTTLRAVDSTGTCCVDMNVGTSGSDLNLNSTSISTGQQVSITSAVITEGNAKFPIEKLAAGPRSLLA